MSKKYMKRGLLSAALAASAFGSSSAFAVMPVFDAANTAVNTITSVASVATAVKMHFVMANTRRTADYSQKIYEELASDGGPTINELTKSIDNSTHNIDNTTQNIYNKTEHIDDSVTNIKDITNWNYDINKEFNYITNNYYGSDPVIIPTPIDENFETMIGSEYVDSYTSNYKNAESYQGNIVSEDNLTRVGVEASAMQKTANDALVKTLSLHRDSINQQAIDLENLAKESVSEKAQGHGNQLQYANALAGAQAAQLIQIRAMMLASENARAATAQADADRTSRQVASSNSLRQGLQGGKGSNPISDIKASTIMTSSSK